jgi:uncharacterized membrane protein (DUF485 family)
VPALNANETLAPSDFTSPRARLPVQGRSDALTSTAIAMTLVFWRPMKSTSPASAAGGAAPHPDDHPELSSLNARSGLWLFFVYFALYAGFMGLVTFAPQIMARPVLAGVNLAITYGVPLIGGALIVAAIYMALCGRNARQISQEGQR